MNPEQHDQHITLPTVPDTMTYTDEERALARQKQAEAEAEQAAATKRRGRTLLIASGSALAGAGLVAGAIFGFARGGHDAAPKHQQTTSAPADPSESPSASPETSQAPQPEATPISAEKYTTPREVIAAYVEQNNNWYAAGATPENAHNAIHGDLSVSDASTADAKAGDAAYEAALFVPEDQWDEATRTAIAAEERIHGSSLYSYYLTAGSGDSRDIEPYRRVEEVVNIDVLYSSANTFRAAVHFHSTDNSDKNRMGSVYDQHVDQSAWQGITWTKVDGNWLISKIEPGVR